MDFDSESEELKLSTLNLPNKLTKPKFASTPFVLDNIESYVCFEEFLNIENQEFIMEAMKVKKKYKCEYCAQIFWSGCALGGHKSKVHCNLSKKKYKKKDYIIINKDIP